MIYSIPHKTKPQEPSPPLPSTNLCLILLTPQGSTLRAIDIDNSPLDELHNRLNEQARLLNEQQKVIHDIQHSTQNQAPRIQSTPSFHQSLPYDPSIPPPTLMSTPYRTNGLDEERTVQVDSPPDIPQAEHTRSDQKQNKYSERYHDDYPSHPKRDQDFTYDDKTYMKREPTSPYQPDSIKSADNNSNLLDDTLTQLLQSQNDIQQLCPTNHQV